MRSCLPYFIDTLPPPFSLQKPNILRSSSSSHDCRTIAVYFLENIPILFVFITFTSYKNIYDSYSIILYHIILLYHLLAHPFYHGLFKAILCYLILRLFSVYPTCFLYSNNICSLYIVLPLNKKVL